MAKDDDDNDDDNDDDDDDDDDDDAPNHCKVTTPDHIRTDENSKSSSNTKLPTVTCASRAPASQMLSHRRSPELREQPIPTTTTATHA